MSVTHEDARTRQRVRVEVTGRPLRIGGAHYNVGERILLDPAQPQHRQVLNTPGWVRRVVDAVVNTPAVPPKHKMIEHPKRPNQRKLS